MRLDDGMGSALESSGNGLELSSCPQESIFSSCVKKLNSHWQDFFNEGSQVAELKQLSVQLVDIFTIKNDVCFFGLYFPSFADGMSSRFPISHGDNRMEGAAWCIGCRVVI